VAWLLLLATLATLATLAAPARGQELTPETVELLDLVRGAPSREQFGALRSLPGRPDWQEVVNLLLRQIRVKPEQDHSHVLLALQSITDVRLATMAFDIDPLLLILQTSLWSNQYRAAKLIGKLAEQPRFFLGRERATIRTLIPLLTSQRAKLVQSALVGLRKVSGQDLDRDPAAWTHWFEDQYNERLGLQGAVYELLFVVQPFNTEEGQRIYRIGSDELTELSALHARVKDFRGQAERYRLHPVAIILVPQDHLRTLDVDALFAEVDDVVRVLTGLDITDITTVADSEEFLPPCLTAFPTPRTP